MSAPAIGAVRWSWRREAGTVKPARDRVIDELRSWQVYLPDDPAETVRLLVSEVLANAVAHGEGDELSVVLVATPGEVFIEVCDQSLRKPPRKVVAPSDENEHGRGLLLLSFFATAWGVNPSARGKGVWFTFATPKRPITGVALSRGDPLWSAIRALRPRPVTYGL